MSLVGILFLVFVVPLLVGLPFVVIKDGLDAASARRINEARNPSAPRERWTWKELALIPIVFFGAMALPFIIGPVMALFGVN